MRLTLLPMLDARASMWQYKTWPIALRAESNSHELTETDHGHHF